MPQLLVDLESVEDCRKAMEMLRRRIRRAGKGPGEGGCGNRGERPWKDAREGSDVPSVAELPLPQKLKRIQSRGMWKHLVTIIRSAPEPLSLPELDHLLGLPKNKMRSLKAIMAKLENRFDLQFLRVAPDAGVDDSGNPRYIMPPKIRRQILRLADQ
jgi:hypothetical protein